jgi:outer membrane protein
MGRFRGSVLFAGCCFVVSALGARAQESSLTLRQAINRALKENPQVAEARADQSAASAGVGMARTALWPHLNFAEDLSRGNDPVYVFGTKLRQQRFAESDFSLDSLNRPAPTANFATRFSGQWMLFNFFGTQEQIRSAKFAADAARSMSDATNQAIVLQVVEAYQAVLYAERQLELANQEQQTADALLHDAQTRVKAGLAIDSDLMSAQVNLAEREQEVIAAEGSLDTAWAALEAALGAPISPRPALRPIEPRTFPDGVLDNDVATALKARPDLQALNRQSSAQKQATRAAHSDFFPQLSAYGNWEMDRTTFAGDGGNNWVAGAQLTFDILPLGKRAHLEQAQAATDKAAAEERLQEQQIRLAVQRAFNDHRTAERLLSSAKASMEQSAESLRILRNRYDAGLATMTDLLRAQDAQRESLNHYWRAAYGSTVAYAGLLYATGQLTPDAVETLQ